MTPRNVFARKKKKRPAFHARAQEGIHRYSPEAEIELIQGVQKMTQDMLTYLKRRHSPDLWPELVERCRGIEEKRIAEIRLSFLHRRGCRSF